VVPAIDTGAGETLLKPEIVDELGYCCLKGRSAPGLVPSRAEI